MDIVSIKTNAGALDSRVCIQQWIFTYTAPTGTHTLAHVHRTYTHALNRAYSRANSLTQEHTWTRTYKHTSIKSRSRFLLIKVLSEVFKSFNCVLLVAYALLYLFFTGAGMVYQPCGIAERNNLKTYKQTELSLY